MKLGGQSAGEVNAFLRRQFANEDKRTLGAVRNFDETLSIVDEARAHPGVSILHEHELRHYATWTKENFCDTNGAARTTALERINTLTTKTNAQTVLERAFKQIARDVMAKYVSSKQGDSRLALYLRGDIDMTSQLDMAGHLHTWQAP